MLGLRGNSRVSDISPLSRLTNLIRLNLLGTSASQEDITKLKGALPGCKILS